MAQSFCIIYIILIIKIKNVSRPWGSLSQTMLRYDLIIIFYRKDSSFFFVYIRVKKKKKKEMLLGRIEHSAWQRNSIQQCFTNSIYLEIFIRKSFQVVLKHWSELPRRVHKPSFFPLFIILPPSYLYGIARDAHDIWLSKKTEFGWGNKWKWGITLLPLVFRISTCSHSPHFIFIE